MGKHFQKPVHRFRIRIKIIIVLRAFPPHLNKAGFLQYFEVMRYGRAGKVRLFRNRTYADAAAFTHLHHFQNEVLPVLIPECQKNFPARLKFICECFYALHHTTSFR